MLYQSELERESKIGVYRDREYLPVNSPECKICGVSLFVYEQDTGLCEYCTHEINLDIESN